MWLNAIIDDPQVCAALAAAIDPEPNGFKTWNTATKLYPVGTTFTPGATIADGPTASSSPTARLISTPLKALGDQLCAEFLSGGPWPNLNARGLTDELIQSAKAHVTAEMGDQSVYQNRWEQFVAEHGYVTP